MNWAKRLHILTNKISGADMKFPSLFSPLQVGPYRLKHRVVMAP
jgi:N-ethylmaleimide reductase